MRYSLIKEIVACEWERNEIKLKIYYLKDFLWDSNIFIRSPVMYADRSVRVILYSPVNSNLGYVLPSIHKNRAFEWERA